MVQLKQFLANTENTGRIKMKDKVLKFVVKILGYELSFTGYEWVNNSKFPMWSLKVNHKKK